MNELAILLLAWGFIGSPWLTARCLHTFSRRGALSLLLLWAAQIIGVIWAVQTLTQAYL